MSADEKENPEILVTGTGVVRVPADSVRIWVGLEAHAKTVAEVHREMTDKMHRVLTGLNALGIPNLQTRTRFVSISPEYAQTRSGERTKRITGYGATNKVSVAVRKAAPDKLGDLASAILDAAIQSGANLSEEFELFLDDPSKAQDLALEKAVKDARRRADIMAKAAGVTITGITSMTPDVFGGEGMGVAQAPPEPGGPTTSVATGDVVVSTTVRTRFTFR